METKFRAQALRGDGLVRGSLGMGASGLYVDCKGLWALCTRSGVQEASKGKGNASGSTKSIESSAGLCIQDLYAQEFQGLQGIQDAF